MFMSIVALGIASALVELYLTFSCGWLLSLAGRWLLAGVLMSIALSAVLGVVFGAAGVTVLAAGLLSTAITVPVYAAVHLAHRVGSRFARGTA